LWTVTLGGEPASTPLIESATNVYGGAFSPDGRWIAYVSAVPLNPEVHVRGYPSGPDVVVARGLGPRWSRDGQALFFENDTHIMAASFNVKGRAPELGLPREVVSRSTTGPGGTQAVYASSTNQGAGYDVLPDGRFLVVRRPDPRALREIVVVERWFEELKRLAP
jgi:Tol biopolymer transport system component